MAAAASQRREERDQEVFKRQNSRSRRLLMHELDQRKESRLAPGLALNTASSGRDLWEIDTVVGRE